jgi:hypothetical protein
MKTNTNELKRSLEAQRGCTAALVKSVPVQETFDGKTVWDGVVHVFRIHGHPKASKAYAWSSPIEAGDERRFGAALHVPPVLSPLDVVRAAILEEHRREKSSR